MAFWRRNRGTKAKAARPKPKKRRVSIGTVLAIASMLVGVGIIAYPTVANWWNNLHQSQALDDYIATVDSTDPKLIQDMLDKAGEYNEGLLSRDSSRFLMTPEERAGYMGLLNLGGSDIMGYIEIPSLRIRYPIRHTTNEDVLQVSIGHLEGSSLPVGGKGTHCVVSGHRGLPSAVLFSDLDKLQEGDTFTVTTLNRTMTYVVDQIRTVEPTSIEDLQIDPDKDYMTLMTCTPYAINSHRLLVRGERTQDEQTGKISPGASRIPTYAVFFGIGLPMLLLSLIAGAISHRVRGKSLTYEEARAAVERLYRDRRREEDSDGDKDDGQEAGEEGGRTDGDAGGDADE